MSVVMETMTGNFPLLSCLCVLASCFGDAKSERHRHNDLSLGGRWVGGLLGDRKLLLWYKGRIALSFLVINEVYEKLC